MIKHQQQVVQAGMELGMVGGVASRARADAAEGGQGVGLRVVFLKNLWKGLHVHTCIQMGVVAVGPDTLC